MELDFSKLNIAVFGDYCLDEYLWIDSNLNEPSLETGLTAYQCTKREISPGAAGTVAKDLANLGVGKVYALGYVGDDGRGIELCRALDSLGINRELMIIDKERVTPTYTKPWLMENEHKKEMSRIDLRNHSPTPTRLEDSMFSNLNSIIDKIDALIIMDQMTEKNCGVITENIVNAIKEVARANPKLLIYADSRSKIRSFSEVIIKGNMHELKPEECPKLNLMNKRPVILTKSERGAEIYDEGAVHKIEGINITGSVDVTGAGDMFTAAFVASYSLGLPIQRAGKLGVVASALSVMQLGTTGYVTAEDLKDF